MAKKGKAYVCVPCGMEAVITNEGTAYSELVCCNEVMVPRTKAKAAPKKAAAPKKKAAAKKAAKKPVKKPAKKAAKKAAPKRKR